MTWKDKSIPEACGAKILSEGSSSKFLQYNNKPLKVKPSKDGKE